MDENIKNGNDNIDASEENANINDDTAEEMSAENEASEANESADGEPLKKGWNRCKKCGHKLERGRDFCPNCGEARDDSKKSTRCKRCGRALDEDEAFCPNCGMKRDEAETGKAVAVKKSHKEKKENNLSFAKRAKRMLILVVVCVVIIAVAVGAISSNVLYGDDKVAYNLIMDVAYDFKNPSSVRLVSGSVGIDDDCLFCGISATNSFGAKTTDYYFIMGGKDPWVMKQEDPTSVYKDRDDLNIKKINKKLEKKLGSE